MHKDNYRNLIVQKKILTLNYERDLQDLNEGISICKKQVIKDFYYNNRIQIRICDFLLFGIIIFNLTALMLTNALVIKESPKVEFIEMNPTTAKSAGFVTTPQANKFHQFLTKQILIYSLFIIAYFLIRRNLMSEEHLEAMTLLLMVIAAITFFDMFWDLSLWIGNTLRN